MAWGEATWLDNCTLEDKIQESNSWEERTKELIRMNTEWKRIRDDLWSEKANEEYKELFDETRKALWMLVSEAKLSREELRCDIEGIDEVDDDEHRLITKEFKDLENLEQEQNRKNTALEKFDTAITDKKLDIRYAAIWALLYEESINTTFIENLTWEIKNTGKISLKTLEELKDTILWSIDIDELQMQEVQELVNKWFQTWDLVDFADEIRLELWTSHSLETKMIKALDSYLLKHPEDNSLFVSEYAVWFFEGQCIPERGLYMEILYSRIEEQAVSNINALLGNYIWSERVKKLDSEVHSLVEQMKKWWCTLEYISMIQDFCDTHLEWQDVTIETEDAMKVIGGIIELKKSDAEIQLMNIRDRIESNTQDIDSSEIQKVIDSKDRSQIETLLKNIKDESIRNPIEWELLSLLDLKREVDIQEKSYNEMQELTGEDLKFLLLLSKEWLPNEKVKELIDTFSLTTDELLSDIKWNLYKVTDLELLRSILLVTGKEDAYVNELKTVDLIDINPKFRWNIWVIKALPYKLSATDVTSLPAEVFKKWNSLVSPLNQLIKYWIENENPDFINKLLRRCIYVNNWSPSYWASVLGELLWGMSYMTPKEKSILKSSIPESYKKTLARSRIQIEKKETTSLEEFESDIALLKNPSSWLEDKWKKELVASIDAYIESNSIVSANLNTLKVIIDSGMITEAPNMLMYLTHAKAEEGLDVSIAEPFQIELLKKDPNYVRFFPTDSIQSNALIKVIVENTTSLQEVWLLMKYINFRWFYGLEALHTSISEKYGEDNANTYIGSDRRFLEIAQSNYVESSPDDVKKLFLNIISASQIWRDKLKASQEKISQLGEGSIQWLNDCFKQVIGTEIPEERKERLLNIYSKEDPSPEDYQYLLETLGSQEKVKEFLDEVLSLKIEEIQERQQETLNEQQDSEEFEEELQVYLQENSEWEITWNEEEVQRLYQELRWSIQLQEGEWKKEFLENAYTALIAKGFTQEQAWKLRTIFSQEIQEENLRSKRANIDEYIEAIKSWETEEFEKSIFRSKTQEYQDTYQSTPTKATSELSPKEFSDMYKVGWTSERPTVMGIPITQKEAAAFKENPEAIRNFINADTYFLEAWMSSMWREYREEIVLAMNMSWSDIQINLNDNSLGEIELLKFAQYCYKITHGKDSAPVDKRTELQSKLLEYGGTQTEDTSIMWDRFITDLNTFWINKELTSWQIASKLHDLANWFGLTAEIKK